MGYVSTKQITVVGPDDITEAVLGRECGTKVTLCCEASSNTPIPTQCPSCNRDIDRAAVNALKAFGQFQTAIKNSKSKVEFHVVS